MPKRKSKKSKTSRFKRFSIPQFLFLLGLILILTSFAINAHIENRLSFSTSIPQATPSSINKPTYIEIPDLSINLPVGETSVENNRWSIYKDGVSHVETSANPGASGNIIMYAHNTKDRFKKLPDIKKGQKIIVTTSDNGKKTYEVVSTHTVSPNDVELLHTTTAETLTIYTCTGFADSKRFVVRATPILN